MKYIILLFILPIIASCAKYVNEQQEDLLVQAITSGHWKVVTYTRDSMDVTDNFSGYTFKFQEDKTVDAIKDSMVERKGTWMTHLATKTITANYPNSSEPLSLLNGQWQITNNSWTYVEAKLTVNNEVRFLRLEKVV